MTKLLIDGKWVASTDGGSLDIIDPSNEAIISKTANARAKDVNRAVQAAKQAHLDGRWKNLLPGERSKIIWNLADLVEQNGEALCKIEAENTGKPYLFECINAELPLIVDNLRFFAASVRDTHGLESRTLTKDSLSIFLREPIGVVGLIIPWNYPLMMAVWKIGTALAAGCTMVLKPAPSAPLSTIKLGELIAQSGIPDGVVNIITGDDETGKLLVQHPDVKAISLTGSVDAGMSVMSESSPSLKKINLELGGKAPFIVFEDIDIDSIAAAAAFNATVNSGQDCVAATRLYVQKNIYDRVVEAVREKMKAIPMGLPFSDDSEIGPLISKEHLNRVHAFVETAQKQSGKLILGGNRDTRFDKGFFYLPTIIENPDQSSDIIQSEVFGPVLTVNSFDTESEIIELANNVKYGLSASVWTNDLSRSLRMAKQLEAGTVWINTHLIFASEAPHGGVKFSGMGKDLSAESIKEFQITKHVLIQY